MVCGLHVGMMRLEEMFDVAWKFPRREAHGAACEKESSEHIHLPYNDASALCSDSCHQLAK